MYLLVDNSSDISLKENIVEINNAEAEEGNDLVDSVSASRQFKGITAALNDFKKSANEVMLHERRMEAAFEDIATGIQKYYEVH